MRRTIPIIFTLFLFVANNSIGQNTLYSYNGKYRISLPAKLELQNSELNNVKKAVLKDNNQQTIINSYSERIVFQQKGLNNEDRGAFNKYCRVIIEYAEEDKSDPTFGRGDKIVVDKDILYAVNESVKKDCASSGTPLIKLITVQGMNINGFPVLYYSYKRKGWEGKQPPVIVNYFRVFNRYESATIVFSYREAKREMWKSIHDNIIKTFTFTKKY